jgi:hypothetical protein
VATNSVLAKLAVNISANTAAFNKGLNDARRDLSDFTGNLTKLAGAVGIAFSVKEVASFALEVGKLAGQAEGVRAAFERLPNNVKLMEELKRATGGTVSELDLMKRAVQANNFEISLAALPRLLEFATLRAQQTGQSVDYLVDSIVTGIGRKSKLILDNLGISAVQLNEALGGASTNASSIGEVADAVGRIAEKNLASMAGWAENASTKVQRLDASWQNFKVTLGDIVNNAGLPSWLDKVNAKLEDINEKLKHGTTMKELEARMKAFNFFFGTREKRDGRSADFFKELKDLEAHAARLNAKVIVLEDNTGKMMAMFDTRSKHTWVKATDEEAEKLVETLETLKAKLDEQNLLFEQTDKTDKKKLENIGAEIIAINKQIEALERLRKAQKDPLEGKLGFFPDLEAEGSTNPNLRNEQAANDAAAFRKELEKVGTTAEFAGGAVIQFEENATNAAKNIKNEWIDIGPMIANTIADMAYQFGQAAAGADDFGKAILNSLAGFAQAFGAALIATGIGKITFDSFSGPAMIAAGAALVAIAGATKGIINNRPNLSRSGGGGSRSSSFSGGGSPNFSSVSGGMQNSAPQYIAVVKGADIWLAMSNYQNGNIFTRAVG